MKEPLVIIGGPTASGKTKLSIDLAKKINGEIISADSMQVYKYMDIGTAKISKQEMEGVKHYLIDVLYPNEEFSIAKFKNMAKDSIKKIQAKGKIPILVGGTGFYINSVIYNNEFKETEAENKYREELHNIAKNKGNLELHDMLKEIDFKSYENIHPNNTKRVIRALEYYKQTGEKISSHNLKEKAKEEAYESKFFIIHTDRKILYDKINKRVDDMIEKGLIDEVKSLLSLGYNKNLISMNSIGYKEIIQYLEKEISLDEAISDIKTNTRRFAKRQITWFKNKSKGLWIDTKNFDNNSDIIHEILKI